jgi:hypothetical protein
MKNECIARLTAIGIEYRDACELRRISMTLHRWFELECGDGNDHGSWCIVRGRKAKRERSSSIVSAYHEPQPFQHDDDGAPFIEHHHYLHGCGKDYVTHSSLPDREKGARKRLAKIMARYPGFAAYVQTDPRGCALYILRPGDISADLDVSSCYTRGIAVYR